MKGAEAEACHELRSKHSAPGPFQFGMQAAVRDDEDAARHPQALHLHFPRARLPGESESQASYREIHHA